MVKPLFKAVLVVLWAVLVMCVAWLAKTLRKPKAADRLMSLCARGVLFLFEVRVIIKGDFSPRRPSLVVSNHLSYLDVLLLAYRQMVRFTPKSEIRRWPFFGWVCRVQGAIFIERTAGNIRSSSEAMKNALAAGEPICLFPEATTGNGLHVLPFKSSFFSLAEDDYDGQKLYIQPVALCYRRIRNLPVSSVQWPDIAWYGDMDLLPHLWNLLKIAPITVEVHYLPVVYSADFRDRKELAAYCHRQIADAVHAQN